MVKKAYSIGVIVYIRRFSRCLEGKYVGRSGEENIGI